MPFNEIWSTSNLFTCEYCLKQFNQKGNFNMHLRLHSGERPFACKHCSYKGKRKHHLQGHMVKVHKIPYV